MIKSVMAVMFSLVLGSSIAYADQISFGATAASAQSGTTFFNGETVSVGNGTSIWMNLKGSSLSDNPVLVIFGIPNNAPPMTAGSVTSATLYDTPANTLPTGSTTTSSGTISFVGNNGYTAGSGNGSVGNYGGADGFAGTFTSGDLYDSFFGFSSITASQQFQSNWQTWDETALGPTPDVPPNFGSGQPINYGIYVYALNFSPDAFSSKTDGFIDLTTSGLPLGSYVVGYALDSSGKQLFTPFTTAGFATSPPTKVSEPSSIALIGGSILFLGSALRRQLFSSTKMMR